jgi:ferredoxin-NADP reductase
MRPTAEQAQLETDVTQVIRRTADAKSIRFRKPEKFDYLPGQWVFLTLGRKDEQKTKPLSLSSSPTEDFLEVTKRLTGQEFSNALAALRVGDKALIKGPYGNFTFQGEYDKVCMLSGGIGITPLRSMIRYSTDMEVKASIILLYSNSYENNIPFEDDFNDMKRRNMDLKVMITITKPGPGWKGLTGRMNREMIERTVPDYQERIFYTSGPRPMVDAMRAMLGGMGLAETQIKQEYFTGYLGAPSR